jgi:hypothetical protein
VAPRWADFYSNVAAVVLSTSASAAPSLTWPISEASISCRMVRYALKLCSSEALESMARARGLSEATIQRLKRCAS